METVLRDNVLPDRPRVCVIGAGALGCVHGVRLQQGGADVLLVDTWTTHVEAINARGLHFGFVDALQPDMAALESVVRIPAAGSAGGNGDFDLAIILATTYAIDEVARAASAALRPNGCALSLQNGYGNIEALAEVLGSARVIGGASYTAAQTRGPGDVVQQRQGRTVIGELDGSIGARIRSVEALFERSELGPDVSSNIQGLIWTKLILNCAINPVSAATGLRHGDIVLHPDVAELQRHLVEEAAAVARAKGVDLTVADPVAYVQDFCAVRYSKPSMLQHVEAGRRTEIDALSGAIAHEAAKLGIDAPYSRAMTAVVKGIEARHAWRSGASEDDYAALERQARAAYSES